jgi:hypothetical protein
MARDTQRDSNRSKPERIRLGRRSYLKMSGTALAATAALAGYDAATTVPERAALSLHGYGGMPVVEQHGSETTNALAGATRADLVAVDETEPNDTKASAQHVGVGSTVDATLAEAEVDWYAFEAARGGRVVLELDRATASGITALILYGPEGDYIDLRYTGSDVPARVDLDRAPTAGTYYAQVVDIQDGSGAYTLDVTDGDTTTTTATPTPEPTATATATPEPTATATPTPEPTTTEVDDSFGEQGYGEYGYGGVTG